MCPSIHWQGKIQLAHPQLCHWVPASVCLCMCIVRLLLENVSVFIHFFYIVHMASIVFSIEPVKCTATQLMMLHYKLTEKDVKAICSAVKRAFDCC